MRLEYFQLIDRIVELDLPGRKISSEATVPRENESTIFQGHFPGYPLMPGVLLIEAMAQTSGWLLLALNSFERMAFLVAVRDAKFRTFVSPGQKLIGEAKVAHDGSGYAVTQASISLDGRIVCDAAITLRVMDFPSPEMIQMMRKTAVSLGLPVPTEALTHG